MSERISKRDIYEDDQPLPPEVWPHKDSLRYSLEEDNSVAQKKCKWWVGRFRERLPRILIVSPRNRIRALRLSQILIKSIKSVEDISPDIIEAIAAYPDLQVGAELAKKVALPSKQLGLVLLNAVQVMDDFTSNIPTELKKPYFFSWWIPKEIIKNQRRLGVSDEDIEVAKNLARTWRFHQQVLQVDYRAPLGKPIRFIN